MRVHTKRTLQIALVSGALLTVGAGSASAAETDNPGAPASPLDQLAATSVDLQHPVQALDPVLHTVPLHLFPLDPAPRPEADGDQPEQDLNAPLGSELAATELPTLPLTATADRPTGTPVDGHLPALPVRGDLSTQPLDPAAGTRVTGLSTAIPTEAGQPTDGRRTHLPAAGLPLLGGLLPSTNGALPTLNGLSDLTKSASLTGLTALLGK
ncbi:hypothetical protein [Amycolatopsis vancoresmycina]|uniref:Secreted protein n=1 Tax=Amycolatopsis vancoresmycina DSM 44592 TaxID=1292037 RepID=R1I1I2_9PSEU|nr:hypothetical protein [Amycolatopsis vancoresmycina]EOD69680.1 hypothetical protein H480_04967 [Amycolatopsis vancoresmycina DSM 44592]